MLRLFIYAFFLAVSMQTKAEVAKLPVIDVIIESVGCNGGPYQPKLGNTLKGIKSFGKIEKEVIQPTLDYEKHTLSRGWLLFDGMELGLILDNKNTTVSFIERATFSNSRWNKISPIAIGSSITDLI